MTTSFLQILGTCYLKTLEISLHASLIICVLLVIRPLIKRSLPPRWVYALWFIVVARLLLIEVPSLPEATSPPVQGALTVVQSMNWENSPVPQKAILISAAPAEPIPAASNSFVITWPEALAGVWLFGAASLLFHFGLGNFRWSRRLAKAPEIQAPKICRLLEECRQEMGTRQVRLIQLPGFASPSMTGLLLPVIILPEDFLERFSLEELRWILLHELAHLKRWDLPVQFLCQVLQAIHWFNPLIWLAFACSRRDRELACDAYVLDRQAAKTSRDYGHVLIKVAETYPRSFLSPGFLGISEEKNDLHERVEKISRHRRPALLWIASGFILCALLAFAFLTKAAQQNSSTKSNTDTTSPASLPPGPLNEKNMAASESSTPTPKPTDATGAYGRLDVEFLAIPSEQLDRFKDMFDGAEIPDLTTILKKSDGKVVVRASTGIRTGGDATTIQIADGQFMILPKIIPPDQLSVEGRYTGTFSSSFNSVLQPGCYQLLVILDQPPPAGAKDSFNAIIARMPDVHWTKTEKTDGGETSGSGSGNGLIPPAPPAPLKSGQILYENRGDNTTGFVVKFEHPNFTVRNNTLVGNDSEIGIGWYALPVSVSGNFQIDFDVYADSNDAASTLMLYDDISNEGILVFNSTKTTFLNHNISIYPITDLTDHDQFYFNRNPLATVNSKNFANQTWTHVTITKKGNTLTDDVNGQSISADLSNGVFADLNSTDKSEPKIQIGLGYHATKNVGGNGQIRYANIRIVQTAAQ